MLRIHEIRLTLAEGMELIPHKIARKLRLKDGEVLWWSVVHESIDARNKKDIKKVYSVDFRIKDEKKLLKKTLNVRIEAIDEPSTEQISQVKKPDAQAVHPYVQAAQYCGPRPVVIGFGPCGIFAALMLAKQGFRPLVLERGKRMAERVKDVDAFWEQGTLRENSNVQFGEGGAGTFSDGKLNTGLKKDERMQAVLGMLVEAGAPAEIRYKQRPHVGTDLLRDLVVTMRKQIEEYGGEIRFQSQLTGLKLTADQKKIMAVQVNGIEMIETEILILALGHSARDTFELLYESGLALEQKPFSIGARIEHPQSLIDESQYGSAEIAKQLGAADYRLSYHCANGRGVYTFCMCPGGFVVASASEAGGVVTNGMSYHQRNGMNANSAVLVGVETDDFPSAHPLAGVEFQRKWERAAFVLGGSNYYAPVQKVGDFLVGIRSKCEGNIVPQYRPGITWSDLSECLPDFAVAAMREALPQFGKKIKGFDMADAVLTGVETRSSSPVRMLREKETFESNITGVFPAGEGAGYAGGILSAAVDGVKISEAVADRLAKLRGKGE